MSKNRVLIDCYTDEPAGLGVPPYLGVWPRYVAGRYRDLPLYLTIDDVRLASYNKEPKQSYIDPPTTKTRKELLNTTRPYKELKIILNNADQFIVVLGIQTPGKYLSAEPGTLSEVRKLLTPYKKRIVITGPVASGGSQRLGGKNAEQAFDMQFDEVRAIDENSYKDTEPSILKGVDIIKQISQRRIIEIETGRGCTREKGCSFCMEPLKHKLEWREVGDILNEVKRFVALGASHFRLGKQSCIFSYQGGDIKQIEMLLKSIKELNPEVLHIDNVNPIMVTEEKVALFDKYLTSGSTAALGAESFDEKVIKENNLNSAREVTLNAIKLLNKSDKLLPGINILLGLKGETLDSLDINFKFLKDILDQGLLLRRINIRQVVAYKGTQLEKDLGKNYKNKNHKYYKSWIEKVRQEIDIPMLKKVYPTGSILKDLYTEVHEGNITFARALGSYPIIVGIRERISLNEKINVEIIDHMPRSLEGKKICHSERSEES